MLALVGGHGDPRNGAYLSARPLPCFDVDPARAAGPVIVAASSCRFRIDRVEPAWDGSRDVHLADERRATEPTAKVGGVIDVPTAAGGRPVRPLIWATTLGRPR
jgi:hypothetical protein